MHALLQSLRHLASRILRRVTAPAPKPARRPRRAALGIECLETRDVMSVTSSTLLSSAYLPDPTILSMARTDYAQHGSINFNDMVSLYAQIERNGKLTSAEVTSLADLATYGSAVKTPASVQSLESKVIYGDRANAAFGNLGVGSSSTQVTEVAGQWFLGTHLPTLVSGEGYYVNYYVPSGNVFGSGITFNEVSQGALGDCTLMSSMAEVAARMPTVIANMFTYDGYFNGTGVWTIRLTEPNGSFYYTTVNTELPTGSAHPVGSALWAPLLEKAFAQANASGWLNSYAPQAGDSYAAINSGNANTVCAYLAALTGLSSSAWTVVSNGNQQVNPTYIAQELQQGKLVVVATGSNTSVLNHDIVPNHCYAVVGYNASSSMPFEVYNPWGLGSYVTYDGHSVYGGEFICNGAFLQQNFVFWGVSSPSY